MNKEKKSDAFEEYVCQHWIIEYVSSGGGDMYPLPICKDCGDLIYQEI